MCSLSVKRLNCDPRDGRNWEGMRDLAHAIGEAAPSPQPAPALPFPTDGAQDKGPAPVVILLSAVVLFELLRLLLSRRGVS